MQKIKSHRTSLSCYQKMTIQDLIQEILQKNPLISQEQILKKLQAERTKTGGLLNDETLLRLIAAKFGVQVQQNIIQNSGILPISKLVAGLYDVNVAGRIVAVFPVKTFQNAEKSGKFSTIILTDKEDTLRVILWNDKTELIEKGELKAGQVVRLMHTYTREDRYGKTELHLGNKSEIEVLLENKTNSYPPIEKFTTKINALNIMSGNVNLTGEIKKVLGASSFVRSDKSNGKIMRLILADDSGEVIVVFWDEKASELENILKANLRLLLINTRVKEGKNSVLEVHVDSNALIDIQT